VTMYWPVSTLWGHSSYEWGIVQGCGERPWKASQMVHDIGPRRWTGEQGAAAVVAAGKGPGGNRE